LEKKKEKVKSYFENKYNLGLLGILTLALVVRLYFFFVAKDQAHWWDTLAYAGLAREMIQGLWSNNNFIITEGIIRPPLFPLVWSIFLRLGIPDTGTLIILELIPSLLSVLFIYLIAKELYNEKVGLIASFMAAVAWIHLFYSVRIMTDVPSLFLALASIYFFVKTYEKIELKYFALSIFLLSLSILTRYSYGLIGIAYIIFLGIIHRHKILAKKNFWIGGVIGITPILVFFGFNMVKYGGLFPAAGEYAASAAEKSVAWYTISDFIPYILQWDSFMILFGIGALIIIGELILGYDSILKIKKLRSHVFVVLVLLVSLFFFVFVIKAAEDRYLLMIFPSLFILSSVGLLFIYGFIRKYSKVAAIVVLVGILLFGAYSQISFGNLIIEDKKTSFLPMKEAFVWIDENTPKDAVILGDWADPYAIHYAGRELGTWPRNVADPKNLENFTLEGIDYLTITYVHQPTESVINYAISQARKGVVEPVKVFFFDEAETQPAVVIFKVK